MNEDSLNQWEKELRAFGIDAVRRDATDVLELIAEVRRLQTMLNRAKHEGASCVMLAERCNALERERDEARAEVARLTAALIDYDTGWRE